MHVCTAWLIYVLVCFVLYDVRGFPFEIKLFSARSNVRTVATHLLIYTLPCSVPDVVPLNVP